MTTLARIKADALSARKAKLPEAGVLVTLIGEIETRTKNFSPQREMTDDEVVSVVRKFIKSTDESLSAVRVSRPEAVTDLEIQIKALEAYLPSQMSEEDLRTFIQARVDAGMSLGQIMGALKQGHPGQYDGKMASAIAREILAS